MIAQFIDRVFETLMTAIRWLLAVAFAFAVALNFANVIGRYVLGQSMMGADEVQIYIMVAMAFLGAAVVSWRGEHLRMDVIAMALPRPVRTILRAAEMLLVIVLAGFVTTQSVRYAAEMFIFDRVSDNASIPMWIPHGLVAIGFGLIALVALWRGIQALRGEGAGDEHEAGKGEGA